MDNCQEVFENEAMLTMLDSGLSIAFDLLTMVYTAGLGGFGAKADKFITVADTSTSIARGDVLGAVLDVTGLADIKKAQKTFETLDKLNDMKKLGKTADMPDLIHDSTRMFQQGPIRGETMADSALLDAMRRKNRNIGIAEPGSEELRLLDWFESRDGIHRNASVNGAVNESIILRPDARKIEALEEFLHGTQARKGIIKDIGQDAAEIHVKDFMIRHKKLLGLSEADVGALAKLMGKQ